jgi:hypothetical protein
MIKEAQRKEEKMNEEEEKRNKEQEKGEEEEEDDERSLAAVTVEGPKDKTSHNMTHITLSSQNKYTYPSTRLPNKLSGTLNGSVSSNRLLSTARFTSFPVSLL